MSDPLAAIEKALKEPNDLYRLVGSAVIAREHVVRAIDAAGYVLVPKHPDENIAASVRFMRDTSFGGQ